MKNYIKIIFIIAIINFIELSISNTLSRAYIIFPLTFLFYSYYVYKSNQNINPIEAFLFGLFVDLISNSYFGLNAILFCLITYLINIYSNSFKLFSNLQICIFFGLSAASYVGFNQLIINLYNFSYLTLLISAVFNIFICIFIAVISMYSGNFINIRK
jgi:rod shape-determining protein MreD